MSYTIKTLTESEDMAPQFGLAAIGESRFASEDLATEETGVAHYRLLPGKRQPFGHRHEQAEEVYVVLSGGGRVKLDDEIAQIGALDAIRVAPSVIRCFEAGPDGLELLVFGRSAPGDAEIVPEFFDG